MKKLTLNTCYSRNYADFTGKGVFLPTVVVFMDGVACGDAVFSGVSRNLVGISI